MDPNLLRNIDYFVVPNNQTINPIDQNASLATSTPGEQPGTWDTSSLPNEVTNMSMRPPERQPNPYSPSKTVLPTRAPPERSREGHQRKRSKISTDTATPYDSVDYWMNFENEEGGISGASRPGFQGRRSKKLSTKRAHPNLLGTPKRSGIASENESNSGSGVKGSAEDGVDDSALENALSDDDDDEELSLNLADHLSRIESAAPTEIPQREGLYSTPLSWEKPQAGFRMDPMLSLQNAPLNENDQQKLIAIAMNPGQSTGGLGSTITSTFGPHFGAHAYLGAQIGAPTTTMSQLSNIPLQSIPLATLDKDTIFSPSQHETPQSAVSVVLGPNPNGDGGDNSKEKAAKGDRTAHNDIERKYRTNLKTKISELRDAVPALRPIPENGVPDDGDGIGQPTRAPKVSKGTVLTKATEYIHWLERRNKAIMREHTELARKLQAFEQLLSATTRSPYMMPNYSRTLFDPRGFC